jgi:hypothetical protein
MATALRIGLAGILLGLVVLAPFPGGTQLLRELHDAAHAPVFGCIAVLVLTLLRSWSGTRDWKPIGQYAVAFLASAFFGAVTELMQIPAARDASLHDWYNDLLGAAAFLAAFAAFDTRVSRRTAIKAALASAAVLIMTASWLPLLHAALEQVRREAQFPMLVDFTRRFDGYYVAANDAILAFEPMPAAWRQQPDERALRISFQSAPWPGVDLHEPSRDWSRHATLVLDVTNPTDVPLAIVVRVNDRAHTNAFSDRFNRRFSIAPHTRTQLRIPLSEIRAAPADRVMNMQEIASLILFREASSEAGQMYLSGVWLE